MSLGQEKCPHCPRQKMDLGNLGRKMREYRFQIHGSRKAEGSDYGQIDNV